MQFNSLFSSYLLCSMSLCLSNCLLADNVADTTAQQYTNVSTHPAPANFSSSTKLDEEKKELPSFKKIRIEGNFNVNLLQGPEHSVLLQGNKTNFSKLVTRVDQDVLTVRTKKLRKNATLLTADQPITLNITSAELEKIAIFGSSYVSTAQIKAKELLIETKGSVAGNFDVEASQVKCKAIGACDLTLTGHTVDSLLSLDGSGSIHAQSLQSDNAKVLLRGSGEADINAQTKLNVNIYGSGQVHYTGNPKVHSSLFGSGQVLAMEHVAATETLPTSDE